MKRTAFVATAAGAAAALAGAGGVTGALAQENQQQSNFTIRTARAQVAGLIAQLQTEQGDYGGHRLNAISNYQKAQNELNAALEVRGETPGQRASDAVLRQAVNQTNSLLGSLKAANADYGGHRVSAINDLQAAVNELNAALGTA